MTHWNSQQWEAVIFAVVWFAVVIYLIARKVTDWFGHREPEWSRERAGLARLQHIWRDQWHDQ